MHRLPSAPPSRASRPSPAALLAILLAMTCMAPATPASAQMRAPEPRRPAPDLPDDVLLGLRIAVTLSETIGLVENEEWRTRLDRIGYRVAAVAGDTEHPYSFDILDLPEPNALALPGGFIFVTRGMFEIELTDAELAHLIGHEISHVRREHFQRAAQLNGLLSLVNTALLVGILVGAEPGGSRERVARMDDPGRREWSVGVTGRDALLQGASLFGNVLSALFARSYSRKLEFEADETGQRLATRAGFESAAGPGLLETLHQRSYEGHHFGYWRTHPYFDDRVRRARTLAHQLAPDPTPADDRAYRERWALFFAQAAEMFPGDREAIYLYDRALRCARPGLATLSGSLEMARFKQRRAERQHPLRRPYEALIAAYQEILDHEPLAPSDSAALDAARRALEQLQRQRQAALSDYLEIIDRDDAATDLLERFIDNYPDHPRAGAVSLRLVEHYRLSDRPSGAIDHLERLAGREGRAEWADSARAAMLALAEELDDPRLCWRLMAVADSAAASLGAVHHRARRRLTELLDGSLSLEQSGGFLRAAPDSPWSERVRGIRDRRAQEAFEAGRVHEGLQRYQDALNAYFAVLAWAPDAPAASQAAEGITRINRLEALEMQ
ncbi:MAG: M48 family metalloprotease [Candidatus Eisenbacteria bacterium]|nr:M48 family metalloprotease [Candidatus Eisenbacteria bacterium]